MVTQARIKEIEEKASACAERYKALLESTGRHCARRSRFHGGGRLEDACVGYDVPQNRGRRSDGTTTSTLRSGDAARGFMARKAPPEWMVAVGYSFATYGRIIPSAGTHRFQQLAEYRQEHGNFDIPRPMTASGDRCPWGRRREGGAGGEVQVLQVGLSSAQFRVLFMVIVVPKR